MSRGNSAERWRSTRAVAMLTLALALLADMREDRARLKYAMRELQGGWHSPLVAAVSRRPPGRWIRAQAGDTALKGTMKKGKRRGRRVRTARHAVVL